MREMREKRESALGFGTKKERKKNIQSILGFITHDTKGNNHNRIYTFKEDETDKENQYIKNGIKMYFLDPLKYKQFNLVIQPSNYLDKLFKSRLTQVNHIM